MSITIWSSNSVIRLASAVLQKETAQQSTITLLAQEKLQTTKANPIAESSLKDRVRLLVRAQVIREASFITRLFLLIFPFITDYIINPAVEIAFAHHLRSQEIKATPGSCQSEKMRNHSLLTSTETLSASDLNHFVRMVRATHLQSDIAYANRLEKVPDLQFEFSKLTSEERRLVQDYAKLSFLFHHKTITESPYEACEWLIEKINHYPFNQTLASLVFHPVELQLLMNTDLIQAKTTFNPKSLEEALVQSRVAPSQSVPLLEPSYTSLQLATLATINGKVDVELLNLLEKMNGSTPIAWIHKKVLKDPTRKNLESGPSSRSQLVFQNFQKMSPTRVECRYTLEGQLHANGTSYPIGEYEIVIPLEKNKDGWSIGPVRLNDPVEDDSDSQPTLYPVDSYATTSSDSSDSD